LGTVAGMHDGVRREPVDQPPHRVEQGLPVAAGEIDPSDRAGEEQVAREQVAVREERDVPEAVPRNVDDFEGDTRHGDVVAAADGARPRPPRGVWPAAGGPPPPPPRAPRGRSLPVPPAAPPPPPPAPSASAATPPMWSTSVCVTRMAAARVPIRASSSRNGV